jgi:hypothetical protein
MDKDTLPSPGGGCVTILAAGGSITHSADAVVTPGGQLSAVLFWTQVPCYMSLVAAVNLALGLFFLATHLESRSVFSKGPRNGHYDERRGDSQSPTSTAPAASAPSAGAKGQYDEWRASQSPTTTASASSAGATPNASRRTSSNAVCSEREHVHCTAVSSAKFSHQVLRKRADAQRVPAYGLYSTRPGTFC